MSDLSDKLRALRKKAIDNGMNLKTMDEINIMAADCDEYVKQARQQAIEDCIQEVASWKSDYDPEYCKKREQECIEAEGLNSTLDGVIDKLKALQEDGE